MGNAFMLQNAGWMLPFLCNMLKRYSANSFSAYAKVSKDNSSCQKLIFYKL